MQSEKIFLLHMDCHRLPQKIVTDNGPSFTSSTFKTYIDQNGIKHICTAPYHPSSRGLAERAVQIFKLSLHQIPESLVREKLAKFLFKYRITPHSSTGVAPAELLMGRRLRSRLDLLKPDLVTTVENSQLKQKLAHDNKQPFRAFTEGEPVYVQDFTVSKQKWISGTIQRATGPVSYIVLLSDGSTVKRHVDNIKIRHIKSTCEEDNIDYSSLQPAPIDNSQLEATSPVTTSSTDDVSEPELVISTRPSRNRRPPKRFDDYVAIGEVSDFEGERCDNLN